MAGKTAGRPIRVPHELPVWVQPNAAVVLANRLDLLDLEGRR